MRFVSILFSLLASAGLVALTYFYAVEELDHLLYMAAITGAGIFLAFVAGHFMYRASSHKHQGKALRRDLEAAELQIHELEALRLQQETDLAQLRQSTMNMGPANGAGLTAQERSDQTAIMNRPR